MYKPRTYRRWVRNDGLVLFEVVEKETDLFISATKDLESQAIRSIRSLRREIEEYVKGNPAFLTSLDPLQAREGAPAIVTMMCEACIKAGVGPMASVAGAMAELVGRDLSKSSEEVIVENGGDIFMITHSARAMGIYAGEISPFTGKLAIEIPASVEGIGVCTSSGTVSHSLSFGNADVALIMADDAATADAAATATGNIVKTAADIERGLAFAKSIDGVRGVVILLGKKMGSWGSIKFA